MPFFNDESSDFNKKILKMISNNGLNVIVCDKKLNVISCTDIIKKTLELEQEINLGEVFSKCCCAGIQTIFETKAEATFYDSIDQINYNIKASYFDENVILMLEKDKINAEVSAVALLTSYNLNKYQSQNILLMDKIKDFAKKSEEHYQLYLRDRYSFNRLLAFSTQLSQLYSNQNTNYYRFECENLTNVIKTFVLKVKEYVLGCDIEFEYSEQVFCDFSKNQIELVIINLISNVFEHCSLNTKIRISLTEKNDNIYIKIKDYGNGIDLNQIPNTYDMPYITSYKDISSVKLGIIVARKIIGDHFGTLSYVLEEDGTSAMIVFPKTFSGIDNLQASHTYIVSETNVEIIKGIAGFENFKSVF